MNVEIPKDECWKIMLGKQIKRRNRPNVTITDRISLVQTKQIMTSIKRSL